MASEFGTHVDHLPIIPERVLRCVGCPLGRRGGGFVTKAFAAIVGPFITFRIGKAQINATVLSAFVRALCLSLKVPM